MLRITFHEPVHVRDKDLCALFSLMDNPARIKIEQITPLPVNGAEAPKRRGRPPRTEATPVATPVAVAVAAESPESITEASAAAEAPKRRGRPPKVVEVAPAPAAEAPRRRGRPPKAVNVAPAPVAAPAPSPATGNGSGSSDLAKRFSALVDTDYEAALELLEDFGANSFTEVKPEDLEEFDKALAELEAETEAA